MRYYLEDYTNFADSILWELQSQFFIQNGISSWHKKVPFYITSNPYIANSYADIILGLILDLLANDKLPDEPIYILELGSGSGKFAYLMLKSLEYKLENAGLSNVKYCYVMSDFNDFAFSFWQENKFFQQLIEGGKLDFAIFDIEYSEEIELLFSRQKLVTLQTPLIVIANYVFDSIRHEGFLLEDGKFYELQVSPYTETRLNIDELLPAMREHLKLDFTRGPLYADRVADQVFNNILADYANNYNNLTLMIPYAGSNALQKLYKIANGALFLIISDKADLELVDNNSPEPPFVAFHGSFSLNVNYDFLRRYFTYLGGNALQPQAAHGLKTAVFYCFNNDVKLLHFNQACDRVLHHTSPSDYFVLYQHAKETLTQMSLEQILAILKLSHYDPTFLTYAEDRIIELIKGGNIKYAGALLGCMDLVHNNFYFIKDTPDVFFSMAIISFYLNDFQRAIKYYQLSINYFSATYAKLYNLAVCHLQTGQADLAREYIAESLEFIADKNDPVYSEIMELYEFCHS